MAGKASTAQVRELLRNTDFRRLYATRIISATADGIFQAGLASYVLFNPEKATTPAEAATALAAVLLPYSLAGPFVGVFLDRWRRQRVLVVSNLVKVGLVLAVAALMLANREGAGFFVGTVAALGVNRLFLAALSAALPHVVEEDVLVTANALATTSGSIATIVGAAIGGLLRLGTGTSGRAIAVVVVLAAIVYAGSSLMATTMAAGLLGPDVDGPAPSASMWRATLDVTVDLGRAARHIVARRRAAYALGAISLHRFLYGVATLTIVLLERNYFTTQTNVTSGLVGLGAVVGATGVGIVVAALVTPRATRAIGKERWITALLLAAGVGIAAFGLPFHRGLIVFGAFVLGIVAQGVKICVDTTVQEEVDDRFRGRVFSVYDMLYNVTYVAAAAVTATVLPESGRSVPVMVALAAGYLLAGLAFGASSRSRARPDRVVGEVAVLATEITDDRAAVGAPGSPKSSSRGSEQP